ncbi:hypothetical protein [Rhodoferax sp. WC2427]|uniref:hypothetical protein n=1 Tax=Rhodoferax sp. WC2427 TaxID=3234144 RepID=UPI00346506B6
MLVCQRIANPPVVPTDFDARWNGPDFGLVCAWLRGIEKAKEAPDLAQRAAAGELIVLPWKGGVSTAIKGTNKVGALLYVAMWLGMRGNDLVLDTELELQMVCTRTGVPVTYTRDSAKLSTAEP